MNKLTKHAKSINLKWNKEIIEKYISEFTCPTCKKTYINTLIKFMNITRFKCDCGQELIIKKEIINCQKN